MTRKKTLITIPSELELLAETLGVEPRMILETFVADLVSTPGNHGCDSRRRAKMWLAGTNLRFGHEGDSNEFMAILESGCRMGKTREERLAELKEYFPEEKKKEVRHG